MTTTVEQEQAIVAARRDEQNKIAAGEMQRRNHINAIATQIFCNEVGKFHGPQTTDADFLGLAQFSVAAAVAFARSVLGYSVQVMPAGQQPVAQTQAPAVPAPVPATAPTMAPDQTQALAQALAKALTQVQLAPAPVVQA